MGRGSFAVCDERPDQQGHPVGTRDTPIAPRATLSFFHGNREPVLAPISPFPSPSVSVIDPRSRSVPVRGLCTDPSVTDRANWQLPPRTATTRAPGAREENRTPDLLITSEPLCRLSYPGGSENGTSRHRPVDPQVFSPLGHTAWSPSGRMTESAHGSSTGARGTTAGTDRRGRHAETPRSDRQPGWRAREPRRDRAHRRLRAAPGRHRRARPPGSRAVVERIAPAPDRPQARRAARPLGRRLRAAGRPPRRDPLDRCPPRRRAGPARAGRGVVRPARRLQRLPRGRPRRRPGRRRHHAVRAHHGARSHRHPRGRGRAAGHQRRARLHRGERTARHLRHRPRRARPALEPAGGADVRVVARGGPRPPGPVRVHRPVVDRRSHAVSRPAVPVPGHHGGRPPRPDPRPRPADRAAARTFRRAGRRALGVHRHLRAEVDPGRAHRAASTASARSSRTSPTRSASSTPRAASCSRAARPSRCSVLGLVRERPDDLRRVPPRRRRPLPRAARGRRDPSGPAEHRRAPAPPRRRPVGGHLGHRGEPAARPRHRRHRDDEHQRHRVAPVELAAAVPGPGARADRPQRAARRDPDRHLGDGHRPRERRRGRRVPGRGRAAGPTWWTPPARRGAPAPRRPHGRRSPRRRRGAPHRCAGHRARHQHRSPGGADARRPRGGRAAVHLVAAGARHARRPPAARHDRGVPLRTGRARRRTSRTRSARPGSCSRSRSSATRPRAAWPTRPCTTSSPACPTAPWCSTGSSTRWCGRGS